MPKPKDWQGEWKSRKPGDYEWFEIQDSVAYHYEFEKPKIMWQWTSKEPAYIWDIMGMYAPNNVFIMTNASKYILALLNSKLITWYFEKISPKVRGGTLIFAKAYIDPIPLFEAPQNVTQVLEVLADYITFLSSTKDLRESEKDLISFIDVQVLDTLIYELYFKEKFIEDGKKAIEEAKNTEKTEKEPIYPQHEKGPFLIDLVAKYLKPIDYDSYAKLAYSIEPLSEKEKQKMEEMKEKYLKTIKEVIEAIKADNEIMGLIERIKQHEWVRVIEGAES
jgi:hypothetical protein